MNARAFLPSPADPRPRHHVAAADISWALHPLPSLPRERAFLPRLLPSYPPPPPANLGLPFSLRRSAPSPSCRNSSCPRPTPPLATTEARLHRNTPAFLLTPAPSCSPPQIRALAIMSQQLMSPDLPPDDQNTTLFVDSFFEANALPSLLQVSESMRSHFRCTHPQPYTLPSLLLLGKGRFTHLSPLTAPSPSQRASPSPAGVRRHARQYGSMRFSSP